MAHKASRGFTLIELLIVITIVGILAAALLPQVLGAPERARDAARAADLSQIQAALELYVADNNTYPSDINTCIDQLADGGSPGILDHYFQGNEPPSDPSGLQADGSATDASCESGYLYTAGDNQPIHYVLMSHMENPAEASHAWSDINTYITVEITAAVLTDAVTNSQGCQPEEPAAPDECDMALRVSNVSGDWGSFFTP